jgi:hypothetical protein
MTILKLEVTTLDIALLIVALYLFASSKRTPPAESKSKPKVSYLDNSLPNAAGL